ncbi:type I restriction endonuclease subunit R [Chryseobacterium sp. LC2016-29]|uniref:type I restriction endonuclease subunit R n=1 Tax=Chryseobacterium sp. LC2016-29 TaxID=2897331 RepID=UPI001E6033EA|nr:type I restriction endonuclease subunit R [Chryseobacterium sp. LC2016-29]MCD0477462.1 type I restriction endonuclease subunit R [Chryseobacterium sp. LC2016-29]
MTYFKLISENTESTVVAEYQSEYKKETSYQSEAELEKAFIELLEKQAYTFLNIRTDKDLVNNLRLQLEKLNNYQFTEKEWKYFFESKIANPNSNIEDKTRLIQEDYIQALTCEDGSLRNIYLIDKKNIHNNQLQVINQYETEKGKRATRYDVTILVNGLPMVHIELKKRGVSLQEAFNQIDRYTRESFWADSGLYEYIQLFVISNGTLTKYYSNTTRYTHIKEKEKQGTKKSKTSNSYEFTSWWADGSNKPILDLMDFGKTFFAKHSILNILTKYCVFTSDKLLLVMRPYQIVATERILQKINVSNNYKKYGSIEAGGFVWHTTGSGKTLTSFKTAQLASKLDFIEKVIFVVDRKDLDYQTMKEYDKFEKGAANSNTNTAVLKKQLDDPNAKIIITTIQKLSILIKKQKSHAAYNKPIVFIFDECHRSQFGDMHESITSTFKKYFLFGFTGTPIFAKNSSSGGKAHLKTTVQAFGCYVHGDPQNCPEENHQSAIHTYTVVDAIADKNVLPFRVDYIRTMKEKEDITEQQVRDIDRERALLSPVRLTNTVSYILNHFDQKTMRNSKPYYMTALANVHEVASARDRNKIEEIKEKIRRSGFNSIFAVSSIDAAKLYYEEFKRQQKDVPELRKLKIATIFSFGQNDPEDDGVEDENSESTEGLSASHRDFLDNAIRDYNIDFKTTYDTSPEKFQNYYKDVSLRMKNREIDLLIVVNMFLTGFDATTLNTLWVDKNLRMHGLLQAYSRTNRILNSIKTFGNIVCFRNLEENTNQSLALFGNKEAGGIVLLKTFDEYYHGYNDGKKDVVGYFDLVNELLERFPIGTAIIGEEDKKEFIRLYGAILKLMNILKSFDEFEGREILSDRDVQDYHGMYIHLYNEFRTQGNGDRENVNDDIEFEMELIKQVEINIDYILMLIRKYHESHLEDKEIVVNISKAIDSSVDLRNKKELIEKFVASLTPTSNVDDDWSTYVEEEKKAELEKIITEEKLKEEETKTFISNSFKNGEIQSAGTAFAKILPPVTRFSPTGDLMKKKETVLEKLKAYFDRFFDISSEK